MSGVGKAGERVQGPLFVFLTLFASAQAHEAQDWMLLTQSYGGTVSLNKQLTKDECEKLRRTVLREDDLPLVESEYDRLISIEWDRYYSAVAWRDAHPQCKNVFWSLGGKAHTGIGDDPVSVDDRGMCDMTGRTHNAMTKDSDESRWRPDTNELIQKYARDRALQKFGFPAVGQDGRPGDIKSASCVSR